jgi:hypothetical protein
MSSGGLDSSVTLDEVFTVLGARRVPLAPELAGYLSLEIAEHADPAGGDVDPRSVFVSEEGTVALVKPRRESASGDAETSVRAILARLLEASGTQTPALAAASKRKGGPGLPALADELETALIPVNRAAGRRALARLAREVRRVTLGVGRNASPASGDALPPTRRASAPSNPAATPPPPAVEPMPRPAMTASMPPPEDFPHEEDPTTARAHIPEELLRRAVPAEPSEMPTMQFEPAGAIPPGADVDALIADFGVSEGGEQSHARELKAMAGLEPTPPPPSAPIALVRRSSAPPSSGSGDGGIESLLAVSAEPAGKPQPAPSPPPARPPRVSSYDESRQLPTGPSELRRTGRTPTPTPARSSSSGVLAVVAVAAVAAGGYGVWTLRPHEAPAASKARAIAPAPEPAPVQCRATLIVNEVPARAEVLLHAGQAPVDVEKMPVGARLEFVATAEGYAPKRVVVPGGAAWDRGPDGKPRFETAVQLDRSTARVAGSDPWPPVEPGSEVGGEGPPGTVHVVATPHGAEVWMLAGMGPQARIEQLQCNHDIDVLVAGPTSFRRRLHVQASDFAVEAAAGPGAAPPTKGTTRVARVSAK